MDDDRQPGFRRRRREADERVRQAHLANENPNVVAFRPRPPPPPSPKAPWRPNALVFWAAILAILIVYYTLTRTVFAA